MLLLLPPEILDLILECLSTRGLLSLRGCCRSLLPVINRRFFSEIDFDFSQPCLRSRIQLIQLIKSMASPSCTISSYVTILNIAVLHDFDENSDDEDESEDEEDQDHNDSQTDSLQRVLSEFLAPSISKLCNLKTICWTYNANRDPLHLLTPFVEALSSLPLRTVILSIKSDEADITAAPLPPLHGFKNLRTLSITSSSDIPQSYCEREIATALKESPQLSEFTLRNFGDPNRRKPIKMCASLQDLFTIKRPDLVRLEIDRVPFPTIGIKGVLSSKLKQLTVSTPPSSRGIDCDWGTLWTALKNRNIELSGLRVSGSENAMNEMVDYLITYSGLQKLEIVSVQMDHQEDEDNIADRLWREVVPRHHEILTTLAITSVYQGGLCYGESATVALSQCTELRDLTLSVGPVDSSWASTILSRARDSQNIEAKRILEPDGSTANCVALILSDLRTPLHKLKLDIARAPASRSSDIYHLDTGTRHKGSPEAYRARQELKQNRKDMYSVLFGMRGVRDDVMNWPSEVVVGDLHFRLCGKSEGNVYYAEVDSEDEEEEE